MKIRILEYLNPIKNLGNRRYSWIFPLLVTMAVILLLEYYFAKDPHNLQGGAVLAIIVPALLIVYFAFREGRRGGLIATILSIGYYLYIISSRQYQDKELMAGLQSTAVLAVLYTFFALIIGWLKEVVDRLLAKEKFERQRLLAILSQMPVGVLISDPKHKVLEINDQFTKIVGSENYQRLLNDLTNTRTSGKTIALKRSGREVALQIRSADIDLDGAQHVIRATTVNDVTKLKELEQRKEDFINMASHELKTPLTSIMLYLELAERYLLQNNHQRLADTHHALRDQIKRLENLVNDLLDFSRVQTGKLSLKLSQFRLDQLIKETVELLNQTNPKSAPIVLKKCPVLKINADRFRLAQVLNNLLINAQKFSPSDKPVVVSTEVEKNSVLIMVKDQGIGIPIKEQKRVFHRLYQLPGTNGEVKKGFGMGLYIAKEIVKQHQGKIWVKSQPEMGSTFFVRLQL